MMSGCRGLLKCTHRCQVKGGTGSGRGASRLSAAVGLEVLSLLFYHSCDLIFPDSDPSRFFSKPSLRSRNTIFTLGTRGSVISPTELEAPILVPHTAQRGEQRVGGRASCSREGALRGWLGLGGKVRALSTPGT